LCFSVLWVIEEKLRYFCEIAKKREKKCLEPMQA